VQLLRKVAMVESVAIEDLALDFTIPGYDIELWVRVYSGDWRVYTLIFIAIQPGGREIAVTMENVDDYIHEVLDSILGKGAQIQAKAFRDGFSKVFPITDLQAFSADELVMLFGNSDEDWSTESKILPPLPVCSLIVSR
jgi:E3 ubiquitin-protein ligase TRIP12